MATAEVRLFNVDEYHEMLRVGILREGEPVELIGGRIATRTAPARSRTTARASTSPYTSTAARSGGSPSPTSCRRPRRTKIDRETHQRSGCGNRITASIA